MATRRHAGHTKKTRPASDPATTRPRGQEYRLCRPQIGEMHVRERGTWKENIQKYLYTKHPKHPWPKHWVKVCAWQGSCDSICMYTHINPQHYIFVKTTLDIPGSPIESQQCPRCTVLLCKDESYRYWKRLISLRSADICRDCILHKCQAFERKSEYCCRIAGYFHSSVSHVSWNYTVDPIVESYTFWWGFIHSGTTSTHMWHAIYIPVSILWHYLSWRGSPKTHQGAVSIRKTVLPGMAIPLLKIRRPNGSLILSMEIAIRR